MFKIIIVELNFLDFSFRSCIHEESDSDKMEGFTGETAQATHCTEHLPQMEAHWKLVGYLQL